MSNVGHRIKVTTSIEYLINLLSGSRGKLSAKDLQIYFLMLKYAIKETNGLTEEEDNSFRSPFQPQTPDIHYILKKEDKFLTTNQIDNAIEKLIRAGLINDKEEGKITINHKELHFEIEQKPVEQSKE